MIHTARQSPKFIRLVRRLRAFIPEGAIYDAESAAIAILERLWHATTVGAMRGDIGRFDDELIAESCGWKADARVLVEMLIECGWIDEDDDHRLVVHDWHEHAPNHVKGNVGRVGGFVNATTREGNAPSVSARIADQPQGTGLMDRPLGPSPGDRPQGTGAPNLTKPNLTKPNLTKQQPAAVAAVGKDDCDDWVFPSGWDTPEARTALEDFAAMRRRIKKPIRSRRSTSKIFKTFDSVQHLIEVCGICEANEWQGLDPIYSKRANQNGKTRGITPGGREYAPDTL